MSFLLLCLGHAQGNSLCFLFNLEHLVMQGMRTWPRSLDPCKLMLTPAPHWCIHLVGKEKES